MRVRGDRSPAENGTALRAALASITDASATKPYVIQLAPGVYELGGTTLAMKPDVSIAGAGADTTRITGDQGQGTLGQALVLGADRTLLRDVTVVNRGDVRTAFHTVLAVSGGATMRIEDAVLEGRTSGASAYALAAGGSSVEVNDSRLTSGSEENPSVAIGIEGSDFRIRGSELVAHGLAPGVRLDGPRAGSTAVVENSSIVSDSSPSPRPAEPRPSAHRASRARLRARHLRGQLRRQLRPGGRRLQLGVHATVHPRA